MIKAKKRKSTKHLSYLPVIGGLICTAIVFYLFDKLNQAKTISSDKTNKLAISNTRVFDAGASEKLGGLEKQSTIPIRSRITYNLPEGWKEIIDPEGNRIEIFSNDYIADSDLPYQIPFKGMRIAITTYVSKDPWKHVMDSFNTNVEYQQKKELLKLDNFDAVSFIEHYEGQYRYIDVAAGDQLWSISIAVPLEVSPEVETYSPKIQDFLQSIKFE